MVYNKRQIEMGIEFAMTYNLIFANTCFKKVDSHLITFKSGTNSGQIDFILKKLIVYIANNARWYYFFW